MEIRQILFFGIAWLCLISSCKVPSPKVTSQINQASTTTKTEKPNVIVIMADDLGYETVNINGGNSYRTPNLDRLALSGKRFSHCYAQPLCTPSRVKLMTGISNVRNYTQFGVLDTSQTTFGNLFEEAGYATCIIGKWQLGKDVDGPKHFGFQEHCLWQLTEGRIDTSGRDTRFSAPWLSINGKLKSHSREEYGPKVVSDFGLDFIERSVRANKNFLLYYPMILTHCPFSPTPDSKSWMTNDTSVNIYKGHSEYFGDMMAYTDKIIGNINAKLEELDVKDNTLIIFTGDNGTDTPVVSYMYGREVAGAKGKSTDAGTRVPLFIQWPDQIKAGSISDDLVDLSDILPTICEAAGVPIPEKPALDGHSLLPHIKGLDYSPRKWIYNWYSRSGSVEKANVFARNQQYKLYEDGRFYEIPEDYLEEKPIPKVGLDEHTLKVYNMLDEVLKANAKKRLELINSQ